MHTLVADRINFGPTYYLETTLVLELALLRISELGQQGIYSITPGWLFNHLMFITPQPWEKHQLLKFFPFMICNSLHSLQ